MFANGRLALRDVPEAVGPGRWRWSWQEDGHRHIDILPTDESGDSSLASVVSRTAFTAPAVDRGCTGFSRPTLSGSPASGTAAKQLTRGFSGNLDTGNPRSRGGGAALRAEVLVVTLRDSLDPMAEARGLRSHEVINAQNCGPLPSKAFRGKARRPD